MKNKKNLKNIIIAIIFIMILGCIFYSTLPIIAPDTSQYQFLSNIINGNLPFSQWHSIRGFGMPVLLSVISAIFGDTVIGLTTGLFISYLFLILLNFLTLRESMKFVESVIWKKIIYFIFSIIFILNPLIIGYSHTVLTEAFAPTFISLLILLAWRFIHSEGKKSIFIYIGIILTSVFVWFIKQPYYPVCLIIIFVSTFYVILETKKSGIKYFKISLPVMSIVLLLLINSIWHSTLSENVSILGKSNSSFLSSGIVEGLTNFRHIPEEIDINYIESNKYISEKEKNILKNILLKNDQKYKDFILLNKMNLKEEITGVEVIYLEEDFINISESLAFLGNKLLSNPVLVLDSYISNYLGLINIYQTNHTNWKHYYPVKNIEEVYTENKSLGLATFDERPIYWWAWSDDIEANRPYNSIQFEKINSPNRIFINLIDSVKPFFLLSFKITLLFVPFVSIYYFIKSIILFKNDIISASKMRVIELINIIFISSFGHLMFHSMLGAVIDRYAYVVYPSVLTGYLLLLTLHIKENKSADEKVKQQYSKVLVTIPAYNESLNIEKVIKELRRDFKEADILVINDNSTDNTSEILTDLKVKFITTPFNLRYAHAVQAGIIYAKDNDYDCVIQFDGDGQHIAKEAKKIWMKMKEKKCDVVIGSRFIEKTEYPHPFFRRVGTTIFSYMVDDLTGIKIYDPTSGLQCLNKEIIKHYSKLGVYPTFPDANLITDLLLSSYKIEEIPVEMRINEQGVSMHGGIIKPIKYMIEVTYSVILISVKHIGWEWKWHE